MRLVKFRHGNLERIGMQLKPNIFDLSQVSTEIPMDMKAFLSLGASALDQPILIPPATTQADFEAELMVVT